VSVPGNTPEEVAEAVARFVETGGLTMQRPGWMYDRLMVLGMAHAHDIGAWTPAFRNRAGRNVNYSINAVGKLLRLLTTPPT
jgi:hypothetical protein